mgnify:CR=1 FL=1
MLKEFDDFNYCHTCIEASKDNYTEYKDKQLCDITNRVLNTNNSVRNAK